MISESKRVPLIHIAGLTKSYHTDGRRICVLRGIHLSVYPGERVAVMGPSGSGKSTFLHVLGLLLPPDAGTYFFMGKDALQLTRSGQSRFRRSQVGFVFQRCDLLEGSTVRENLEYPLVYADVPRDERGRRIADALGVVGLSHRIHYPAGRLSGGEQQRVAVARALVNRPRVILADEPTGHLDRSNAERMMDYFRRIVSEAGTSLVVATHNTRVSEACDRVYRLEDGLLRPDNHFEGV
jgi:putative ABC transport system ATP-binding protein